MRYNMHLLWCLTVVALLLLLASGPQSSAANQANGEQLFTTNCGNCHGREGEGFLKVYPPIHDSRFLKEDVAKLPCIIRYGLKGEITVGTTTFNQIMPPIQIQSPEQMSDLITFMQKKWNHPQTDLTVGKWLESCSSK